MHMDLVTAVTHTRASLMLTVGSLVVLIYDHILTFGAEVESIWSQPLNFATTLFYMNRYLQYITIAFDQAAVWIIFPTTMCHQFVKWEGIMTVIMIAIADMILILRVYCLYGKSKIVLGGLALFWCAQIAGGAYGLAPGIVAPTPPGFHMCVLTSPKSSVALVWALPALTDAVIFILTVYKTIQNRNMRRGTAWNGKSLLDVMFRDGLLYFTAVAGVNIMNVIIYFSAPPDLKVIGAMMSQVISAVMISRLQINLRRTRLPNSTTSKTNDSLRTPYTPNHYTPVTPNTPYSPYRPATSRSTPGFVQKPDRDFRGTSTFLDMNPGTDYISNAKSASHGFLSLGNLGEDIVDNDWAATADVGNDVDLHDQSEPVRVPRAGTGVPRVRSPIHPVDRIELADISSPVSPVSPWDRPLPPPRPVRRH